MLKNSRSLATSTSYESAGPTLHVSHPSTGAAAVRANQYITIVTVDPKWDEGHQLLWKGRLAKYAFRGIRVRSYPYGCLVPGQTLLTPSKGIADTPGDQVKSVLGAFGVPGYAPVEHPIIFEIVDDETKDRK